MPTLRTGAAPSPTTPWLFIALVAAASVALSFRLSCATPFAAIATLAALQMRRGDGLALVGLAWALNQAVGYLFLGYPHEFESYAWGAAIGVAALGAYVMADVLMARLGHLDRLPAAGLVLVAAFVVYEVVLFAVTAVLPASELAFSWPIVGEIGLVNALVCPALMLAYRGAELAGLTGAPSRA
jgi:hypothetical protein